MEERLLIRYPRNSTETGQILQNLENRLNKMGKMEDKYRRSKIWLYVVHEINVFYNLAEKKIKEANELVHKSTTFVDKVRESLKLHFHERNLKAIKHWMAKKKVPRIP